MIDDVTNERLSKVDGCKFNNYEIVEENYWERKKKIVSKFRVIQREKNIQTIVY